MNRDQIIRDADLTPELVQGAVRRDPDAIVGVYRALSGPVYGYLLRQIRDPVWAQDLTGEVFCEVIDAIDRFEGSPGGLRAWVFRIARNTMIDQIRRESHRRHESIDAAAEAGHLPQAREDAEAEAISRVEQDRILGLVDELSEDQRDVVLLRIVADLSVADVAEILEKTPGAVKALQHRAMRTLAGRIRAEGGPGDA